MDINNGAELAHQLIETHLATPDALHLCLAVAFTVGFLPTGLSPLLGAASCTPGATDSMRTASGVFLTTVASTLAAVAAMVWTHVAMDIPSLPDRVSDPHVWRHAVGTIAGMLTGTLLLHSTRGWATLLSALTMLSLGGTAIVFTAATITG